MRLLPGLALVCGVTTSAVAAPITWVSTGTWNPNNVWTLPYGSTGSSLPAAGPLVTTLTFDPTIPGTLACPTCVTYYFPLLSATLQLGDQVFSASGGEIGADAYLPFLGASGVDSGLIQFQFAFRAPSIVSEFYPPSNGDVITVLAGYYDSAYVPGMLPTVPSQFSPSEFAVLGDFNFETIWFGNPTHFPYYLSGFTPQVASTLSPVPEPTTMALLGSGVLTIIGTRKRARQRSPRDQRLRS